MGNIHFDIDANANKFVSEVGRSEKELDKLRKKTEETTKTSGTLGSTLGKFAGVLAVGAFSVAALGVAKFIGSMKELARLAGQQVASEQKLAQVLHSTGHAAGMTSESLIKMAASLQKATTFGDEEIINAQALMLTFTRIGKEVFPQAMEAALDMSAMLGQDLKNSTIQLGKALNDPIQGITALRRVGIQLSDAQEKQIKTFVRTNDVAGAQKVILDELSRQMGGQARSAALTYEGSIKQLHNVLGDTKEVIGMKMLPGMHSLTAAMANSFSKTGALTRMAGALAMAMSFVAENVARVVRWFDILNNTSQMERLIKRAEELKQKMKSYAAKDQGPGTQLYEAIRKKLSEVNEQMEDLSENTKQIGLDSQREWGKVQEAIGEAGTIKNDPISDASGKYKAATSTMVEYYERLGMYQTAAQQQEDDAYNKFITTEYGKKALSENSALLHEEYLNRSLLSQVSAAQQEVALREQVLRAKLGLESQAFVGAQMFANAGAQLMSSQNKKLFKIGQAASIANVWMNTATAITKGYAQLGAFGGTAFAALMGVVAGVQTGNILKQKPPGELKNETANLPVPVIQAPKFAQGVFDIPNDTFARLHAGETVIPKNFTESIKAGEMSLGGGGITVNVYGDSYGYDDLMGKITAGLVDIERRSGRQVFSSRVVD